MYQQTDRYLKLLREKIRKEFNHLSVIAFDELNVLKTSKLTQSMFERLMKFNKKQYEKMVHQARLYAITFLNAEEKEKESKQRIDEDAMVESVLIAYNLITGYLYKSETERKRLRLAEEMLTAREYGDRSYYAKTLNKTANLWFTQSSQYAIEMEDETVKKVWKTAGIKKVKWVTENDNRVCSVCKGLNGQIFEIDNVPPKQHYHCRCTIKPVK